MSLWRDEDDRITDLIVELSGSDIHIDAGTVIYTIEVPVVTPPSIECVTLQESSTSIVVAPAADPRHGEKADKEKVACEETFASPERVLRLLAAEVQAAVTLATEQGQVEERLVPQEENEELGQLLRLTPRKSPAWHASAVGTPTSSTSTITAASSDDEEVSNLEEVSQTIRRMKCRQEKEVQALRKRHANEAAPVEADLFTAFFDKVKSVSRYYALLATVYKFSISD
jgi:hypothetical protein